MQLQHYTDVQIDMEMHWMHLHKLDLGRSSQIFANKNPELQNRTHSIM